MRQSYFKPKERLPRTRQCSCGGGAKLIKRRYSPHGRNSPGFSYQAYVCGECNKTTIV